MKRTLGVILMILPGLLPACSRGTVQEAELTPAFGTSPPGQRMATAIAEARCRQAERCNLSYPEILEAGEGSCVNAMLNDTYAELTRCVRPVQVTEANRCIQAIDGLACSRLGALRALSAIEGCSAEQMCAN